MASKLPDTSKQQAMDITIKQYQHGESTYARRPDKVQWEKWKPLIASLHNEGVSRQKMCERLAVEGFHVQHGQLVRRMTKWGMTARERTNISPQPSTSAGSDDAKTPTNAEHHSVTYMEHDDKIDLAVPGSDVLGLNSARIVPRGQQIIACTAGATPTTTMSFPSGIGVDIMSNIKGTEAQARVLQKMEAAESEFPDVECCCDDFFKAVKPFKRWQPLYQMLLDSDETSSSLHNIRALIYLCRGTVPDQATTARLQASLQYYNELLSRTGIKNDFAYAIALELARIYDDLPNEDLRAVSQVAVEFFEKTQNIYQGETKALQDKYSHLYDRMYSFPMLQFKSSDNPEEWIDNRDEHRQRVDSQLLGQHHPRELSYMIRDCCKVVLDPHNLDTVAQFAQKLSPWPFREGHTHARAHFERTNTIRLAQHISRLLMSNLQYITWPSSWCHSATLVSLVCDAFALMGAQEFYAGGRAASGHPNNDIRTRLIAATSALNVEGAASTNKREISRVVRRKLLQAMWICDPNQALFAPQGLHIGPCKAKKCWDILAQSVKQFDKTTSIAAPTALPRKFEHPVPDDVSMLSSSTKSSFQKFRRLSLTFRLKSRSSSITMASNGSKWSGHMSIDSLTPEKVLGVGPEVLGPTLPVEEHKRLDEEAFRAMQTIRV